MADCTRKLRQERGASVVFALVVFLIVTIFSWTMVNGALTAAQNASTQREEEQAYLSVTSAARLFCHKAAFQASFEMPVPSSQYVAPFSWAKYWQERPDKPWKVYSDSNPVEVVGGHLTYDEGSQIWTVNYPYHLISPSAVSFIQKTSLDMVKAIDQGASAPQTATLTMTHPKNNNGASDMVVFNQVRVQVTMYPEDYSVKLEFENVKPHNDFIPQHLKYYVVVTLKCTKNEPTPNASSDPVIVKRNLKWEVKSVERGRS